MKSVPGVPYVPPMGCPEIEAALIGAFSRDLVPYLRLKAALKIPEGLVGEAWWAWMKATLASRFGIPEEEFMRMTPMEICLMAEASPC